MSLASEPHPRRVPDADAGGDGLTRTVARLAVHLVDAGVAAVAVPGEIRRALITSLAAARCPDLRSPELAGLAALPAGLVESCDDDLSDRNLGDLSQALLGWEVGRPTGSPGEIELPADDGREPVVLCRRAARRRALGAYFTPPQLVDTLVAGALQPWADEPERLLRLKIVDPACGDGRFLVAAARWIWERLEGDDGPDPRVRQAVINECLFGIDIDPLVVHLARVEVWLAGGLDAVPPAAFFSHLALGDGLLDLFHEDDRFDVVIGNPPFGSFSGRQVVAIDAVRKQEYHRRWGGDAWETLHGMFVRRGLALSRHTLAMVLPTQVTHLEGYANLRDDVQSQMSLHDVTDWGEDVFGTEAVAPVVTMIARRDQRGRATWSAVSEPGWITALRARAESLGSLVADPGVHTGNCASRLITAADANVAGAVPVLEGKQVHRYRCGPPTKCLHLDYRAGEGEYFTVRPRATYQRARFLIRQTARFPIVGPRLGADYFRNSLLALYEPTNGVDVRYLVGLLNSRLIRYLYTVAVRESGQAAFPQVKIRSLRALPILWPDLGLSLHRQSYASIIDDVESLLTVDDETRASDSGRAEDAVEEIERRIDECVFTIYGLDDVAIAAVRDPAGSR